MATIKNFFDGDYLNWASYENLRSIASVIDGFVNVRRKILYTALDKSDFKMRVDLFANEVIAHSKYIHGKLDDSVVNMSVNYTGSNNIPLFKGYGDFGARLDKTPSATRYINLSKRVILKTLFRKEDLGVLINQKFEGFEIEPMYYVPVLPMLLLNSYKSPSVGFSNSIFSRNIIDVVNNIYNYMHNIEMYEMIPYFEGFKGEILKGKNNKQWIFKGVAEKTNTSTVIISELPIINKPYYDMITYRKVLLKLKAEKKITSFEVENDTKKDIFRYVVKFKRDILAKLEGDKLLEYLKLIGTDSEILFFLNENNKVQEYSNIESILKDFCDIRMKYYKLRKKDVISKLKYELKKLDNKIRFIEGVSNGDIIIKNQSKANLDKQLKNNFDLIKHSYDYLYNMNIFSLSTEIKEKLKGEFNLKTKELNDYENKSINEIWWEEILEVLKSLNIKYKKPKLSKPKPAIKNTPSKIDIKNLF